MGVLVFVLVSGYIITPVLGRGDMAEFVVKRAFRIDPLYLAAVLGEAAWLGTQGRASPAASTLLWRASLLGDWAGKPCALGGVEWTLRRKLGFCLLMAVFKAGLPWLYALLAVAPRAAGPGPTHTDWARGCVSQYFPCLSVGSAIQLGERGAVRRVEQPAIRGGRPRAC